MRFWDSSALVPLLLDQPLSMPAQEVRAADDAMVVWWGTEVECWSALARVRREGGLDLGGEEEARALLGIFRQGWAEVLPSEEVRWRAGRLLRSHPLRVADALQLGAALTWAGTPPSGELVTFDERLARAARIEGLAPVPG